MLETVWQRSGWLHGVELLWYNYDNDEHYQEERSHLLFGPQKPKTSRHKVRVYTMADWPEAFDHTQLRRVLKIYRGRKMQVVRNGKLVLAKSVPSDNSVYAKFKQKLDYYYEEDRV